MSIQVDLSDFSYLFKDLKHYMARLINNLGRPDKITCILPNTLNLEQAVIELVGNYQNLEKDEIFGYPTEGSSFGSLQALWILRDTQRSKNNKLPKLLYFDNAHSSIKKYGQLLNFKDITVVKTGEREEIDLQDLKKKVKAGYNYVIVCTAGTVQTGSYDNILQISNIMEENRCNFDIHLDAALGGMILPFINLPKDSHMSHMTFKNPHIKTMVTSLHKFIGLPMPCGIFICRRELHNHFEKLVEDVEYCKVKDSTLHCSRNGVRSALAARRLLEISVEDIENKIKICNNNTHYIVNKLKEAGMKDVFCHDYGMAVVIPVQSYENYFPDLNVRNKLEAKHHFMKVGRFYHGFVMGHINREKCEIVVKDYISAFNKR